MNNTCWKYLPVNDAELFTAVCLPEGEGPFPTVIYRSPYVDVHQNRTEDEITADLAGVHKNWTSRGYAVVFQHCRGRGKSSGDCIPYINEREDGLALQAWVRTQPFYNGEIYLCGKSYTASVHYVTAPFADDIKGAVLQVQDCERYNCNYRNGFYKMGLHGGWYPGMYKKKSIPQKNYVPESYHILPLTDFPKTVLGEEAADFDAILRHPDRDDPFWQTRFGGGEARDAVRHADIPILLVTVFYDIYTGGVFDMWNRMDDATRAKSALVVHPYDHGCNAAGQPVQFEGGTIDAHFGDIAADWMDYARGKSAAPASPGKVTYYHFFHGGWRTDDFAPGASLRTYTLGEGERSYVYNPYAPASFKGGMSANFAGNAWQDKPDSRYDICSFILPPAEEDISVRGKITAKLRVKSDCEDTCFYIRLSLEKPEGWYGLRDDIQQISNFDKNYVPGEEIDITFSCDEHAFVIAKGERLRVDVSSSAFPWYVRHTNNRGLYCEQTTAKIAHNTVICSASEITLPVEES